ncbi:hypothetical protein RRG08_055375 [Elysia crispata]|uniref:Uncharacterized protein n=1 Tax=Elysia crispata TaxID=231223 RepID=A0AAE1ARQ5_9GAST|nr:hypothetical protein RRG08_055375 [Elysia crispata]
MKNYIDCKETTKEIKTFCLSCWLTLICLFLLQGHAQGRLWSGEHTIRFIKINYRALQLSDGPRLPYSTLSNECQFCATKIAQ